MTYEQLDRSIDADSDSDDEMAEQAHLYRSELRLSPMTLKYAKKIKWQLQKAKRLKPRLVWLI
jgi:hypothetical protein